jgi:hypothetical protein
MSMARLAASYEYAGNALARPDRPDCLVPTQPLRLTLERPLDETAKSIHCGNGLFLEVSLPHLVDLAPQLSHKEQTLAVYGFTREHFHELAMALPPRALDRITPIGEALSFAPVWDGQDLITAFSRKLLLPV